MSTAERICADATDVVGSSPMVYLNSVAEGLNAKIAVKLEYMNPSCSTKDRLAAFMIDSAEQSGQIQRGKTVLIEGSSGNMGIALAVVAAIRRYRLILVVPDSASLERRTLLRAYGAEVVLVPQSSGLTGVLERMRELNEMIPNSFVVNQFSNPANIDSHRNSTGPEIWRQSGGQVDLICYGVGTGGTLSGVGDYLRQQKPSVRCYAVEPFECSILNGFPFGDHTIFGLGPNVRPANLLDGFVEALRVRSADAIAMAWRLAREEGLLAGCSGGANVCAAIELAKRPENVGKLIVTSLPDFGERYLSTVLYDELRSECAQMKVSTAEENRQNLSDILKN